MTKINTILQCFVDLNLETDENTTFFLDLPEVSFEQPIYSVDEGSSVNVIISLSAPSVSGLEEVEIGIVANNTSLSDFGTLGEIYPQTLAFSAGQQTHTISFDANTDIFEEGSESFDVILSYFTNTVPGQFITTTVNIVDLTDLKEVFINEQGGILVPATPQDPARVDFSVLEGNFKDIKISLDSPSVLGVESVQAQITNISTSSNDYLGNVTTTFSWAPGEQHKTLQIAANSDELIEDSEFLKIQLVNAVNANIFSPSEARLEILDGSPEPLYANFNFQGSYIQYGGINSPTVELRWIRESVAGGSYEPIQNEKRFLKFGHGVVKNYSAFNTPNGSAQGYGYDAGSNVIVGYDPNLFGNLQRDNVVFFGGKPSATFVGSTTTINNTGPKTYGDLRLKITNAGSHPASISGSTIAVGDSITVIVNKFDYNITLPTNNGLLSANTFFQGANLTQDTLTQCLYNFTFEVDFEEVGFKLRNEFNSVSSNKKLNIGTHLITEVYTESNAILPQNQHNLVTQMKSVWPFWESNFSFPQNAPYCIAAGNISTPNPIYPTDNSDLQRVWVDGITFLHQDATTENNTWTGNSSYEDFIFLPSGQTASSSGCTGRIIEYNFFNNPPYTNSIPFKVII